MFRKLAILLFLLLQACIHHATAQDSIRVTLLTCSPGQEVYSLYGHTAIRLQQPERDFDAVFNYGVFDFNKPHFTWHFILGQCDYMVQPIPWDYFIQEYKQRGSSITEQELNLTQQEAQLLLARLVENCRPENCEYRYNFLYNNCTTRVRDIVEQTVGGEIQYPDTLPHNTFRQILHRYTTLYPWAQEGNDLLLGAEVDTLLSLRPTLFVPENLMRAYDGAIIVSADGDQRPLVRQTKTLLEARPQDIEPEFPLLPWQAMTTLAAVCLFVMALEALTRRIFWLWDIVLLLAQGSVGCLLTFMFLFSAHPGVSSNWQVWVLNPLFLAGLFLLPATTGRHRTLWYAAQFAVLTLFLLFSPWIPQVFAKITVPLALCLLTRPVSYYIFCHRKTNRRKR